VIRRDVQEIFRDAVRCHQGGELAEAQRLYRAALAAQPGFAPALHLLGVAMGQMGKPAAAVDLIRRAIAIHPTDADYHSNLATFLIQIKQEDAAIESCRRAIALRPGLAEAHLNLGVSLVAQDKIPEATAAFAQTIQLKPDYAEAHSNLGAALKDVGQLEPAAAALRRAIALDPQFANAHWNLGLIHLLMGYFQEGWKGYEWRLKLQENAPLVRRFSQPRWNGEELEGRTILLIAEQGFGDVIQFIRYAPLVARRGAKVLVWAQPPLRRLLQRVEGVEQVVCEGDALPAFDLQCPLLSLPGIFGTTLANIPADGPYVHPDPASVARWTMRLAACDRRRRIGLVWAGGQNHKRDRIRSISPLLFSPLANVKDVRFFSLQKTDAGGPVDLLPKVAMTDWSAELCDFAETAALIANLDLVITVDTAVAHLAGAMGKPVWVLLPFILDWRWMLDRGDSPWYPTMRLFRQRSRGDWSGVVERVATALGEATDSNETHSWQHSSAA